MVRTMKPLLDVTTADLMSRDVVTISSQMSLRAAAHELARARVSGAPVVGPDGRCIGVLSATDMVHWMDGSKGVNRREPACMCCDWQVPDPEALPPESVCRFMTTDVVTAPADTRLGDLARRMLDAHIHRIIITDEGGRPVGIVAAMDVLAAVALEEARRAGEQYYG